MVTFSQRANRACSNSVLPAAVQRFRLNGRLTRNNSIADHAECRDDVEWQIDEGCEPDHRASQGPNHDQQGEVKIKVELPGEAAQDDDFQKDKLESALLQKAGEF